MIIINRRSNDDVFHETYRKLINIFVKTYRTVNDTTNTTSNATTTAAETTTRFYFFKGKIFCESLCFSLTNAFKASLPL